MRPFFAVTIPKYHPDEEQSVTLNTGVSSPRSLTWWGYLALTYALATLAGAVAAKLEVPLPWMLGPFFSYAVLSVIGRRFVLMPMARELGQVAIGTAVGLHFTSAVLLATFALLPAMALATIYVMVYTMVAAFIFGSLAKVDNTTAFFATAAGGVADMAIVAKLKGGVPGSVAVVHAMRVSMVVAVVPLMVFFFGRQGSQTAATINSSTDFTLVVGVLLLGYLGALMLKPTPLPNPWLVGPVIMGIIIGVSGLISVHIPSFIIVLAQIMLGTWLGCQFKRDVMSALPRVTAAAIGISLFTISCAGIGSFGLSAITDLPVTTSFLALAPAAVTEMVLTAQVMNLDAEIVTAFHVMRIAVVSSTVLLVFKLYLKIRGKQTWI